MNWIGATYGELFLSFHFTKFRTMGRGSMAETIYEAEYINTVISLHPYTNDGKSYIYKTNFMLV